MMCCVVVVVAEEEREEGAKALLASSQTLGSPIEQTVGTDKVLCCVKVNQAPKRIALAMVSNALNALPRSSVAVLALAHVCLLATIVPFSTAAELGTAEAANDLKQRYSSTGLPLDEYINKPEEVYNWTECADASFKTLFGGTAHVLNVTRKPGWTPAELELESTGARDGPTSGPTWSQ